MATTATSTAAAANDATANDDACRYAANGSKGNDGG